VQASTVEITEWVWHQDRRADLLLNHSRQNHDPRLLSVTALPPDPQPIFFLQIQVYYRVPVLAWTPRRDRSQNDSESVKRTQRPPFTTAKKDAFEP
jgi:hypothetical protein